MPYQRRRRLSLWGWLGLLFRQPPRNAYGSGLRIETLTAGRITLRGTFLRTDFSSE